MKTRISRKIKKALTEVWRDALLPRLTRRNLLFLARFARHCGHHWQ